MADTMAVIDRNYWLAEEQRYEAGNEVGVGDVLDDWDSYVSSHPLLERYLDEGDRLFLVTARGENLWLVAVYEDVELEERVGKKITWRAARFNRVPIIDISVLRSKLVFHTGNGLTSKVGRLGNSLQSPRMLTDDDVARLEAAIAKKGCKLAPSRRASPDREALEGESFVQEVTRYLRDPLLGRECFQRDKYTCRHCGFTVDKKRFPELAAGMSRVVQAHHLRLVSAGKRKNKAADLITLCPTCHMVAHALASVHDVDKVDLKLLSKHYRPVNSVKLSK